MTTAATALLMAMVLAAGDGEKAAPAKCVVIFDFASSTSEAGKKDEYGGQLADSVLITLCLRVGYGTRGGVRE